MDKSQPTAHFRTITPVAFEGASRLTFKRLRSPTRLPKAHGARDLSTYLGRISWLFGVR